MSGQKQKRHLRPILVCIFLVMGLVVGAWSFLVLWNYEALKLYWQEGKSYAVHGKTSTEAGNVTIESGSETISSNVTISVEDYSIQIESRDIHLDAYLEHQHPPNGGPYAENLTYNGDMPNFTLSNYTIQYFYGDQLIGAPVELSIKSLPLTFAVAPFAKTVITFSYSYVSQHSDPTLVVLDPYLSSGFGYVGPPHHGIIPTGLPNYSEIAIQSIPLQPIILPIAGFVFCGLSLALAAWFATTLRQAIDGYDDLANDCREEQPDLTQLKDKLRTLFSNLNTLNYQCGLFFAPGLTLLKVMIQERLTYLNNKSKYEASHHGAPLQEFLDDDSVKPASGFLDFKSITLVIGFLTSTGIILSWNVGAMGPLVLSIGLLYLCYNLGFLLFVVRNRRDLAIVIFIIFFVIVVVSAPHFIDNFRNGILNNSRWDFKHS